MLDETVNDVTGRDGFILSEAVDYGLAFSDMCDTRLALALGIACIQKKPQRERAYSNMHDMIDLLREKCPVEGMAEVYCEQAGDLTGHTPILYDRDEEEYAELD